MESELAELSSSAATLDELVDRVTAAAGAVEDEREDVAAALYEVERSLRRGSRQLRAVLRAHGPHR